MNLPTQAQVNAATRHAATFAAGAIMMFGLSTKINPDQVTALINSLGTAVNDIVIVIGLVTPMVAAWAAARSASTTSQLKAITTDDKVKIEGRIVTTPEIAEAVPSEQVVSKPPVAKDPP